MGREIRSVPLDWEHPKDEKGHYRPLNDQTWLQSLCSRLRYDLPYYLKPSHWKEIAELWPDPQYCRPYWPKHKAIAFQMYETVSEGTPVSPVFETLDGLKLWLVEQGHSEHAAAEFCKYKWAPSMTFSPTGGFKMDIDFFDDCGLTDELI
jgi:hypothetical protein